MRRTNGARAGIVAGLVVLAAISPMSAFAQHAPNGGGEQGGHSGGPGGGDQRGGGQGGRQQSGGQYGGQRGSAGGMQGGDRGGRQVERERAPNGYSPPSMQGGGPSRPQSIDRQAYNHNFNADHGYHVGPYRAPYGYRYRRWGYGEVLPRAYWGRNYWMSDYWLFGLDVPPVDCEWVRYGPDALLIDIRTGEILQVIYGRFL